MEINHIKVEILSACESAKYLGKYIPATGNSRDHKPNQSVHRYKQELTSIKYFSQYRLRLLSMVITPTFSYASGTWTLSKEHERNDTIDTMQNASPHRSNKEKVTGRKLNTANMKMLKMTEKQTTEAQTKKLLRAAVQIPIATKTATFSLPKTPMKRVTRAKSKKKIGSNT